MFGRIDPLSTEPAGRFDFIQEILTKVRYNYNECKIVYKNRVRMASASLLLSKFVFAIT